MLIIGIDPDTDKPGIAVTESGKVTELNAMHFFDLQEYLKFWAERGAHFALEDVESNKPTFSRKANIRATNRISQNVGQVKYSARLIRQWLDRIGATYTMVKPLTGSAKLCKNDADRFNQYTGWHGSSNADKRDAAMLALALHARLKRAGRG